MGSKSGISGRALAGAACAVALSACTLQLPALRDSAPSASTASGTISAADELRAIGARPDEIEPLSSGILAKNSSKLSGTVELPASIIAKHSSKYRVAAAVAEVALANADVVLMTPAGRYIAIDGKAGISKTDANGRFDFSDLQVPAGLDILVVAYFDGATRQVSTYLHTVAGENRVDVNLASTYVTRYFLEQATRRSKEPKTFNRGRLAAIVSLTRSLLEQGHLPVDGSLLDTAGRPSLVGHCHAAVRANPTLLSYWTEVLGSEPVPVGTAQPQGPVQSEPGDIIADPA